MADLTVQTLAGAGLEATFVVPTVTVGNKFLDRGDKRTFARVKNNSGSDMTATVKAKTACKEGNVLHDEVITITTMEERDIGPFEKFQIDPADSKVQIICSVVTDILIAAIRI